MRDSFHIFGSSFFHDLVVIETIIYSTGSTRDMILGSNLENYSKYFICYHLNTNHYISVFTLDANSGLF